MSLFANTVVMRPSNAMAGTLIVCDIDGVILSAKGRDHLRPVLEYSTTNENWMAHQLAINSAPDPILVTGASIVASMAYLSGIVFLTSRLDVARPGTIRDLERAGFMVPDVIMRKADDHRPAPQMKYEKLVTITQIRKPRQVVFIDDEVATCDEIREADASRQFGCPVSVIHLDLKR